MYSPTMRLLAVLELLETYDSISGTTMSKRLEVDKRTIRRYIENLQDMGIPVTADRGPHGAYRLDRGSRLPPLIFNDSEAGAIALGLMVINQMNFPIDGVAAQAALVKIERLLPQGLLDYVNELKELIKIHNPAHYSRTGVPHNEFVSLLSLAVKQQNTVVFHYSATAGKKTTREVDLYGLVLSGGQWYTAGFCHLRQDLRTFRLDRLFSIERTKKKFTRPENFDLLNFVLGQQDRKSKGFNVEIFLETTIEHARAILPSETLYLKPSGNGVMYGLRTSNLHWLAFSLLNLSIPFSVREPSQLTAVFQEISEKAARFAKVE